MNQFQSQGQWENESTPQPFEEESFDVVNKAGKKFNKGIYTIVGLVFVAVVVGILVFYTFARPIEGIWVRQADDHYGAEGMTVEVTHNGSYYEGKVITGSNDSSKFKEGQIKWLELKKTGFATYECFDLCLDEDSGTFYYDGTVSTLTILRGGDTLNLVAPKSSKGANQIWTKQK